MASAATAEVKFALGLPWVAPHTVAHFINFFRWPSLIELAVKKTKVGHKLGYGAPIPR